MLVKVLCDYAIVYAIGKRAPEFATESGGKLVEEFVGHIP